MVLKEVNTLVGHHFGDGFNTEIFWAKRIILRFRYVFGEVVYDGSSYHSGIYIFPLRVQILKHKIGYLRFGMTVP